jgi:adenylate cyclase
MEDRLPRKLAAILYADVAGYSRLMGEDEEGTHRRLSEYLDLFSGEIDRQQGKIVHYAGDAILADFPTATDALTCAVSIQKDLATRNQGLPKERRMEFRIGINLGEVIVDRDDIYGDGVNIAARLESLAHPSGICVSESARTAIGKKLPLDYEYLGEQQVKNIAEPVRAYHVTTGHKSDQAVPRSNELPKVSNRLAIAVLPFANMSGDSDQEYFADGLTEDIIASLSVWRSFPVISRNSTFTYKNRTVKVQQVAEELGARYVLEGSVRKGGSRVRVTAQLTDTETGHSLWAQKFDRDLEDIFAVQDEITHRITATVVPEFEQIETKRSARKHPNNLDAWDYYLRGLSFVHKSTKDGNVRAHEMFRKALELEPDYGPALSGVAYVLNRDLLLDNVESFEKAATDCLEAAKRAVDLDESAAISRTELVRALLWCRQHDAAIREAMLAIELNPSNALAQGWFGAALVFAGREEEGIPRLKNALELAPRDPRNRFFMTHLALAYLNTDQLELALDWARLAAQRKTDFIEAPVALASILAHSGKEEEARTILTQFGIRNISSIETRPFWCRYLYPTTTKLVFDGLRKAGIESKPPIE